MGSCETDMLLSTPPFKTCRFIMTNRGDLVHRGQLLVRCGESHGGVSIRPVSTLYVQRKQHSSYCVHCSVSDKFWGGLESAAPHSISPADSRPESFRRPFITLVSPPPSGSPHPSLLGCVSDSNMYAFMLLQSRKWKGLACSAARWGGTQVPRRRPQAGIPPHRALELPTWAAQAETNATMDLFRMARQEAQTTWGTSRAPLSATMTWTLQRRLPTPLRTEQGFYLRTFRGGRVD